MNRIYRDKKSDLIKIVKKILLIITKIIKNFHINS
jgi:hypothetical protein